MNVCKLLRNAKGLFLMASFMVAGLVFASNVAAQQPITYQGQLKQSGAPFTEMADLQFQLFDSLTGGSQVGSTIARAEWPVEDGLFQVELDFGAGSFGAAPRWLQITVDGTTLVPRQRVHAAPMAMFALAGNEGPPGPAGPVGPEGPAGDSHWIINGTATAYLHGRVGVGTVAPSGALDVHADSGIGFPQLRLFETQDDYARLTFGNAVSDRFWSLAGLTRGADPLEDRFNLFHSISGDLLSVRGSGEVGVGFNTPPSRLAVMAGDAWTWSSGNGRGDFHVGDGSVGLSMGVALGGGGRGVSRIWTNGGVENLFIGSAGYGASMSILPGQVGINTTAPTATLDVDGGARVRGLSHTDGTSRPVRVANNGSLVTDPVSDWIMVPLEAFVPSQDSVQYAKSDGLSGVSGSSVFLAALQLPHGAEITEVTTWFRDDSAASDLLVVMCRRSTTTAFTNCNLMATLQSAGASPNIRSISETSVGVPVIDNENYSYHLRVATTAGWSGFTLALGSVRIGLSRH